MTTRNSRSILQIYAKHVVQNLKGDRQNAGKYIENIHEKRGIKQTYVASVTKIPPQVLGQILNENRKLEASEYFKICSAVNADPVRLAEESGIWEQDKAAQLV